MTIVTGNSGGDADVQMNYSISCVHAQWFSCQQIKADNCDITNDVTVISCYFGRELLKESTHEPQGCCLGFLVLNGWAH